MCSLSNQFKLCSCDFNPSEVKYTWSVYRGDLPTKEVVGECPLHFFDIKDLSLPELLEHYMNHQYSNQNLFDKDFLLREGDVLAFYEYGKLLFQYDYSLYRLTLSKNQSYIHDPVFREGNVTISNDSITKKELTTRFIS